MIEVGVKIEKPRGLARGAEAPPPTWRQALTAGLGQIIRRRVTSEGVEGATVVGDTRWIFVAPDAPGATAGKKLNWGAYLFQDLRTYHAAAGVRRGSFHVTGGMWKGLACVPDGRGGTLMFRSSSRSYITHPRHNKRSTTWQRERADNMLKAWVVYEKAHAHVLDPSGQEIRGFFDACVEMVRRVVSKAAAGSVQWERDSAALLGAAAIERHLVGAAERGETTI